MATTAAAEEVKIEPQNIATALYDEHATVASVAEAVGRLGKLQSAGYAVETDDPQVSDALIGIRDKQSESGAPEYLDLHLVPSSALILSKAIPFCSAWEKMPFNPDPPFNYQYACQMKKKAGVQVTVIATFSAAREDPEAKLLELLFQRNVW